MENNETIKVMNSLVNNIEKRLANDLRLYPNTNKDVFDMVFVAFNHYMETNDKRHYYVYNIHNKSDLLKVLKNPNVGIVEIGTMYEKSQCVATQYFNYDDTIYQIGSTEELIDLFIFWLDEVILDVVAYPYVDEYRKIYTKYVTDVMIENNIIWVFNIN